MFVTHLYKKTVNKTLSINQKGDSVAFKCFLYRDSLPLTMFSKKGFSAIKHVGINNQIHG